jgi:hypothetical protein
MGSNFDIRLLYHGISSYVDEVICGSHSSCHFIIVLMCQYDLYEEQVINIWPFGASYSKKN